MQNCEKATTDVHNTEQVNCRSSERVSFSCQLYTWVRFCLENIAAPDIVALGCTKLPSQSGTSSTLQKKDGRDQRGTTTLRSQLTMLRNHIKGKKTEYYKTG